jgi:hypothetical protein
LADTAPRSGRPAVHQRGDAGGIGSGACRPRNAERGMRKGRKPQSSKDGPAAMLAAMESGYPPCVQPSTNRVTAAA